MATNRLQARRGPAGLARARALGAWAAGKRVGGNRGELAQSGNQVLIGCQSPVRRFEPPHSYLMAAPLYVTDSGQLWHGKPDSVLGATARSNTRSGSVSLYPVDFADWDSPLQLDRSCLLSSDYQVSILFSPGLSSAMSLGWIRLAPSE